jgi:hypothetical protein
MTAIIAAAIARFVRAAIDTNPNDCVVNIPTPTALVAKPAAYAGLLNKFLKFFSRFSSLAAMSLNHSRPLFENIENGGIKLRALCPEILHP